MPEKESNNSNGIVAKDGIWKGLHPGMGLAAKGMVVAFVVFTALNVEFANGIYSAGEGLDRKRAERVLH